MYKGHRNSLAQYGLHILLYSTYIVLQYCIIHVYSIAITVAMSFQQRKSIKMPILAKAITTILHT